MTDDTVSAHSSGALEPAASPEPSVDNGGAPPPRRREPRIVTPRGTPVSKCKITLNTEYAQRVFFRCWDRLKADLYVLTVRTRTFDQNEAAGALEAVISESFDKARTDLAADLERTEVLRDHAQVRDIPEYDDRLETVATFSTPRARQFLALVQQMDQLLVLYDALWLAGFAETQERIQRSQNWQRRLVKMTNRLRELANRTRSSLARQQDPVLPGSSPVNPDGASADSQAAAGGPDDGVLVGNTQIEEGVADAVSEADDGSPGADAAGGVSALFQGAVDPSLDEVTVGEAVLANGHDESATAAPGSVQTGPQRASRVATASRRS
jgi:hypothetical protein